MKTGKGIGAAVLIAALLLAGAQLLVRTYFSSRATQMLKTSLQDTYGDTITFDALLFNLLSSQAEIEQVHLTFPHGSSGTVSSLTAESIIINIPGKDLFSITSPAFDVFSVSRGVVTLKNSVYTYHTLHSGASFHITAEQLVVDFSSIVPLHLIASSAFSQLPSLLRQFHYIAAEAQQVHLAAPQLARMFRDLEHLFSEEGSYSPAASAALFEAAAPELFMGISRHLILPETLAERDRNLVHSLITSTLLLVPGSSDVFTSSYVSLRADRASPNDDIYTFQGDMANEAGNVYSAGELYFPDAGDAVEVRELYVSIDSLHTKIASLLGSSSLSFSFGR